MLLRESIKYEGELDKSILNYLLSIPACSGVLNCIQCGTCSGSCPMSDYMDYTPRRIIAMVKEGFREVLSSFTIWLCSSCYSCTVACPQEIGITDIMYALKRKSIEERVYPKGISVLAREFFNMVKKNGRSTELILVLKLLLKTGVMKAFFYFPLGLNLIKTGRLSLKTERVKDRAKFRELLNIAQEVSR